VACGNFFLTNGLEFVNCSKRKKFQSYSKHSCAIKQ
jgi:hypothetical protein